MEIRARFLLIGLFALAVIAAGFGFVYWMENTSGLGERTVYRIRFDQSVSGLLLGSAVQFNGIRVGEVTDLKLNPDDPRQVLVTIAIASDTPMRADTSVGLAFGGLTGVPEISLAGGTPSAPPPPRAEDGGPPLLIAGADAGVGWTDAAREAFGQVTDLISNNSDALKETIGNLDTFSKALAKNSDKLDGIVEGLVRMTGGGAEKPPTAVVDMAAASDFPAATTVPSKQLVVVRPSAPVALETQRIMVESEAGLAPSFDGVQWSDSVPILMQSKIIESFENAGYAQIGTDMAGLAADYQLMIELRAFDIAGDPAPKAEVDFTAKLVDAAGSIVASKRFQASAPLAEMSAGEATAALNRALAEAEHALVVWTFGSI